MAPIPAEFQSAHRKLEKLATNHCSQKRIRIDPVVIDRCARLYLAAGHYIEEAKSRREPAPQYSTVAELHGCGWSFGEQPEHWDEISKAYEKGRRARVALSKSAVAVRLRLRRKFSELAESLPVVGRDIWTRHCKDIEHELKRFSDALKLERHLLRPDRSRKLPPRPPSKFTLIVWWWYQYVEAHDSGAKFYKDTYELALAWGIRGRSLDWEDFRREMRRASKKAPTTKFCEPSRQSPPSVKAYDYVDIPMIPEPPAWARS